MKPIDQQLQQQIDAMLIETGEYTPSQLLINDGRLMQDDYQAWLKGDIEYLEDVLFGEPAKIKRSLLQAHTYASKLPVVEIEHVPSDRLFSRDSVANEVFEFRFRKSADLPQMDLFFDGGAANLVNGIIAALSRNDIREARTILEQLYDAQPDNSKLHDLEILVSFAEQPMNPGQDNTLDLLQNRISGLAQAQLAQGARGYLSAQWRRLSETLAGRAFDPETPPLHTSYTAIQAADWNHARQAVEQEPRWRDQPLLLSRHVQACARLHQNTAAIESFFILCWRFPRQVEAARLIGELKDAWLEFQDLDAELPTAAFPAWYVLKRPGLASALPAQANSSGDELFQLTARLLQTRARKNVADEMALRQKLHSLNPTFFHHFLTRLCPL